MRQLRVVTTWSSCLHHAGGTLVASDAVRTPLVDGLFRDDQHLRGQRVRIDAGTSAGSSGRDRNVTNAREASVLMSRNGFAAAIAARSLRRHQERHDACTPVGVVQRLLESRSLRRVPGRVGGEDDVAALQDGPHVAVAEEVNTSRRSAIDTRLARPTLMPRSSATTVASAAVTGRGASADDDLRGRARLCPTTQ